MKTFKEFLNEKLGINDNVKKLSNILFNKVKSDFNYLKSNKILIINNFLQENYKEIVFINDKLTFKISNKFNAGIISQINKSDIILNLNIEFNVNLDDFNNLKSIIFHEFTHVIENFYSKELSKDWDIYKKFIQHKNQYKNYDIWINISNMFYDTMSHEMRSRLSQTYQYLKSKNTQDVKELKNFIINSKEYKKLNDILKVEPVDIIKIVKQNYENYNDILTNFMENVYNTKYSDENFIKLFNNIKTKVRKQIKKLLRLVSTILYENSNYIEQYEDININYSKYIEKCKNDKYNNI